MLGFASDCVAASPNICMVIYEGTLEISTTANFKNFATQAPSLIKPFPEFQPKLLRRYKNKQAAEKAGSAIRHYP